MRKRGWNKRGESQQVYYFIIQILLLAFIFVFLLWFIAGIANNTLFYKLYYSRDLALMTGTLFTAPGTLYYAYPYADEFTKEFEEYKVTLSEPDNEIAAYYSFMQDIKVAYKGIKIEAEPIEFTKSPGELKIGTKLDAQIKLLDCPDISTRSSSRKKTVIDPAYNFSDKGAVNINDPDFNEADLMFAIADTMHSKISATLTRDSKTKDVDTQTRLTLIDSQTDILISLRAGDFSDNRNILKAYIPKNSINTLTSSKFACKILNTISEELSKTYPFSGLAVIPSDDPLLHSNPAGVAVILELGNIQIDPTSNFLNQPGDIAVSIYTGVQNYYST